MVPELPEHRFPRPSSIKEGEVSYLKNASPAENSSGVLQLFAGSLLMVPTRYYKPETSTFHVMCQVLWLFCPHCVPTTMSPLYSSPMNTYSTSEGVFTPVARFIRSRWRRNHFVALNQPRGVNMKSYRRTGDSLN